MSEVIIKKVAPYPIEVKLTDNRGQVFMGKIVKLTQRGFLVDTDLSCVHVGHFYQVSFLLPASRVPLDTATKAIRTIDQMITGTEAPLAKSTSAGSETNLEGKGQVSGAQKRIWRLAELHFVGIHEHQCSAIRDFLVKIGQKEM